MAYLTSTCIFLVILLPGVIQGHPNRKRSEDTTAMASMDTPSSTMKAEGKDFAEQMAREQPSPNKDRPKRLSDQRRAELETLMALSKMTGKLVTVSRGGRQLDASKLGRRRRSILTDSLEGLKAVLQLSGGLVEKGSNAYYEHFS